MPIGNPRVYPPDYLQEMAYFSKTISNTKFQTYFWYYLWN